MIDGLTAAIVDHVEWDNWPQWSEIMRVRESEAERNKERDRERERDMHVELETGHSGPRL